MRIPRFRLWGIAPVALGLIGALAVLPAAPAQAAPPLRVALWVDPLVFDPHTSSDLNSTAIIQQLYDTLYSYNSDGKLVPSLAESAGISDDAKTYTIKLRKGVKFHTGRELTAEDIKFNLQRALTIKGATGVSYLDGIVGAAELRDGKAKDLKGVEVVDRHTVRVRFANPNPVFLKTTSDARMAIVNPDTAGMNRITLENPSGSGPFTLVSGQRNFKYVLAPFKDYWRGPSKLPGLELHVVESLVTAMSQYENNELDLITPPPSQMPRIREHPVMSKEIKVLPRGRSCIIGMNYKVLPQWKEKRVRLAFIHALDTKTIAEVALEGTVTPARSIQPPIGYGRPTDLKALPYDPEAARKLLAEAGYPGGKGFPELTLISRPQGHYVRAMEAAAGMFNKNLGVNVRVRSMEMGVYTREVNQKDVHAFFINCWTSAFLDPSYHLADIMTTDAKRNRWNYADKAYDDLIGQALVAAQEDERVKLFLKAEEYSIKEGAVIPVWYDVYLILVKGRVSGVEWVPVGNGYASLWSATVKE